MFSKKKAKRAEPKLIGVSMVTSAQTDQPAIGESSPRSVSRAGTLLEPIYENLDPDLGADETDPTHDNTNTNPGPKAKAEKPSKSITTTSISNAKNKITPLSDPLGGFSNITQLFRPVNVNRKATKNDTNGKATANDANGKATSNDVNGKATANDVNVKATANDANRKATSNEANGKAIANDANGKATANGVSTMKEGASMAGNKTMTNVSIISSSTRSSQQSLAGSSQSSPSEDSFVSSQSGQDGANIQTGSSEEAWLKSMESRLNSVTKGSDSLTLQQFKNALRVNESFFVDRFFHLVDKERHGSVGRQKMLSELRALTYGTQTEKIKFLFDIYNITGTGKIMKSEVQEVLKNCIHESRIHISAENLQAMTDAILMAADKDRDGKISFNELRDLVERHPTIAGNMAMSTLLSSTKLHDNNPYMDLTTEEERKLSKSNQCCRHLSPSYVRNNLKKVVCLCIYVAINLGLMALALWQYWESNNWIKISRASGQALNFNCTLVLVLMLRVTMTRLRNTPLVQIIPFDQHIMFHKICGYTILVQCTLHFAAHIGNACVKTNSTQLSAWEILLTTRADVGWVAGSAYITGYLLLIVLIVMVALSLPFVRKTGCFEIFYWSHKLYLIFWIVLLIHASNFWKWFVVPGTIFLVEIISRLKWVRSATLGKTYIERVCLLPSEVTQLIISKPAGFTFKPGDYVFIQVPAIAKYEWHPFTISSAPEERDSFWLHIRTAGHWTRTLNQYFTTYTSEDEEQGLGEKEEDKTRKVNLRRRASSIAWLKSKPMKARKINANIRKRVITRDVRVQVHIDGPYGSPSRHIFEAEHAVLFGSGIGVTPFASILQSIVYQYKAKKVVCPKCSYNWCHETPSTVMNLKKVDFIWINRDQRHFEWFASLMSRLEREQEIEGGIGHILDMHMFMTSALPKTDMKGLGLQLALDLVHQSEKTDLITGLQTRTQAGRPDFDQLFTKIRNGSNYKIKVFFCGSPALGKVIKAYSHKYGFGFAHETF